MGIVEFNRGLQVIVAGQRLVVLFEAGKVSRNGVLGHGAGVFDVAAVGDAAGQRWHDDGKAAGWLGL